MLIPDASQSDRISEGMLRDAVLISTLLSYLGQMKSLNHALK
jgi:hypothetical protein